MTAIQSITSPSGIANGQIVAGGMADLPQSAPDTGVGSMSFGDFLDMINPLQHIPVVSEIYRSATGDTISPTARIAGDSLYGAAIGVATGGATILASAGIAAIGAIGDEVYTANNEGESASGTVIAALFGNDKLSDDKDQPVQLASNDTAPAPQSAPLQQVAAAEPPKSDATPQALQVATATPPATSATTQTLQTPVPQNTTPLSPEEQIATLQAAASKAMPLDRSKQAYGGVMDPALTQNAMQNQTLALAMASGNDKMESQHALRNSRFATTDAKPVTNATPQSAALPLPGDATSIAQMLSGGSLNPAANLINAAANKGTSGGVGGASLPAANTVQNLGFAQAGATLQGAPGAGLSPDLRSIKGLDQYRSTAQSVPAMGSSVDVTN
ncbi:MAG: hypothetical protein P4M15_06325 [Alphaproteobacteria bacterium]|nr:hypothetical protein [Alphaproteobacteria bacterium]